MRKIACVALRLAAAMFLLSPLGATAMAQQAGVLLGYSDADGYKTMWIVFSPTEARVVATVPDLIVPRSTGFWRLATAVVCEYDPRSQRDSSRDVVWQTPIDKAPLVNQHAPCKSHSVEHLEESEHDDSPPHNAKTFVPLCGKESGQLLFVSPEYFAEEFNASDRCDARGGHDVTRDEVRPLNAGDPISLTALFADQAAPAYSAASDKGFAENSKEINCAEPNPDAYDLKSWSIAHARGAWHPVAAINEFMGECALKYQMNLALPRNVTGEVSKTSLWAAMAKAVPHLSDFYLSPLGDYALVLVAPKNFEYHLYAYAVRNGVLANRLAEIPWENVNVRPVVMAQWSSGKYVPQWTEAIQKIHDHPLPGPVVRPEKPSDLKVR